MNKTYDEMMLSILDDQYEHYREQVINFNALKRQCGRYPMLNDLEALNMAYYRMKDAHDAMMVTACRIAKPDETC